MNRQNNNPDPSLWPGRFGYVVVEVPDVDATIATITRYFRLQALRLPDGRKAVRGGDDHHWVIFEEGPRKKLGRLAFETRSERDLELYSKRLSDMGIEIEAGSSDGAAVGPYLRFSDPDGNQIELYTQMMKMPHAVPRGIQNTKALLHTVVLTPDVMRLYDFYAGILGFRESDWVEDSAVFLRVANGYHHSLALMTSASNHGLDHICFLMETLDDVMRMRARSLAEGLAGRTDVKRHALSGSISYYVEDPTSGLVLEAAWDHVQITDEESYRPRVLPRVPETANLWLASDDGPLTAVLEGPLGDD